MNRLPVKLFLLKKLTPLKSALIMSVIFIACLSSPGQVIFSQSVDEESDLDFKRYPWLDGWNKSELDQIIPMEDAFASPEGYVREEVKEGSVAWWLRGLPIRTDRTYVLSYEAEELGSPSAGVILMDVGKRNLQQCADSVIRLHAEYLWYANKAKSVVYHFTSGDKSSWKAWKKGERFKIDGRKVQRIKGKARRRDHKGYRSYLQHLFRYARTQSLRYDSKAVKQNDLILAGDFFVSPGSPGHAVMILDTVINDQGERLALVGQGYMPAQEFHVLEDSGDHVVDKVWFRLPVNENEVLNTPSWTPFERSEARRFSLK